MTPSIAHNFDIYIKECRDCAQTCRVCAEAYAYTDNSSKFAGYITACLECAVTCEDTAKALLLYQKGTKTIQETQIRACIYECMVCWQICKKNGKLESLEICAGSAHKCAELLLSLSRNISPKKHTRASTVLKRFGLGKAAM